MHHADVRALGHRRWARWSALAVLLPVLALGTGACGGDDEPSGAGTTATTESTMESTTTGTTPQGREIFLANCATCHTLSDAGSSGTVGPNLDEIDLSTEQVADQVENGGGGMPAFGDTLSDEEIDQVAAYVAGARGS